MLANRLYAIDRLLYGDVIATKWYYQYVVVWARYEPFWHATLQSYTSGMLKIEEGVGHFQYLCKVDWGKIFGKGSVGYFEFIQALECVRKIGLAKKHLERLINLL